MTESTQETSDRPASLPSAGVIGSGFRAFEQRELLAAYDWALAGGQALHLMAGSFAYMRSDTPNCFKGQRQIAHLFDQNRQRLIATARRLGVRVIRVEREAMRGQHIDLCGQPLKRALALCPNYVCTLN